MPTPINYAPCVLGHPGPDSSNDNSANSSTSGTRKSNPTTLGEYIAAKSSDGVDQASVDLAKNLGDPWFGKRRPAPEFLDEAAKTMRARAQLRDKPSGERSMELIIKTFNTLTGHNLTTAEGWELMILLKMVRGRQGFYDRDSYVDGAAYFSLLGEEESTNSKRQKP